MVELGYYQRVDADKNHLGGSQSPPTILLMLSYFLHPFYNNHGVFIDKAYMGIIDEWYTIFQKIKTPHGLILPIGLMSQTFELSFPAFTLARC